MSVANDILIRHGKSRLPSMNDRSVPIGTYSETILYVKHATVFAHVIDRSGRNSLDRTAFLWALTQTQELDDVGMSTFSHDPPFSLKVLFHLHNQL